MFYAGKHRCLGAAGSFQTLECDCSVPDCGCSTGPALTACSSRVSTRRACAAPILCCLQVPAADILQYIKDVKSYCRMDRQHTLCKYKDGAKGRCGNKVCARGFTEEGDKNRVVDKHNEFRRELAEGDHPDIDNVITCI